jgi:hypothetical protein
MAHAGGSGGGGFSRPTNFTEAEMRVLWENDIVILPSWHLPHGWHISMVGSAVPPLPEGAALDDLICRWWKVLPLHERDLTENTPRHGIWLPRLQRERHEELGEFTGPYTGRYNIVGRWRRNDPAGPHLCPMWFSAQKQARRRDN